jgi:serine/threonine-protein kinase
MRQFAGYTIVRAFPPSGMTDVFVALAGERERVILRCLREDYARQRRWRRAFSEGASRLRRFRHRNIVRLLRAEDDGQIPYMVLEYVEAETLRTLIRQRDALLSRNLLHMLRQMAEALCYVHGMNYLHLDFKPDNVLVQRDARIVLIDFDLMVEKKGKASRPRSLPGTPAYLPPEALLRHQIDERADVYAFGVTAYEMATGHQPFERETWDKERIAQTDNRSSPPSLRRHDVHLPAPLERLMLKCLAKQPADRYPSMSLILRDLAALV